MLFQRPLQPFGPLFKEKIFCVTVPLTTVLEAEAGVKATGADAGVTRAAVAAVEKIPAEEGTTGKNLYFDSLTTLAALQLFCTL